MPNRLAQETSPYLLQHANNPVDWFPWGSEALERARREDKPILLSIGYAACHWCHVMEHESFENAEIAALMNALFVNIKVDREERPDLDGIYMQAVQAMTGHGGWPMTVFLSPNGEPFYGGTYFPPTDRHGTPGFPRVLRALADAYREDRDAVVRTGARLREIYDTAMRPPPASGDITHTTLDHAYRGFAQQFDERHAGFGGAPKFPPTMGLDFLLRYWARTGAPQALDMVTRTFRAMSRGGIYDQVGGGLHRYSVDERWLVPHFEKMLYDNALLVRLGAHLYQATGDAEVRRVSEATIQWLDREMTSPEGGFYSSLDADSEGHEGRFYVWTEAELDAALGKDTALVKAAWGVSKEGNFEGQNILSVPHALSAVAARNEIPVFELEAALERACNTLYRVRASRIWPARDDKVLASWNALMLRAVCEAARAFNSTTARTLAIRNGEFLRDTLVRDDRVLRSWRGGRVQSVGFLEDHAAVALAFLDLFALTSDPSWLHSARRITDRTVDAFREPGLGLFFDTARDHEALVTRPRDITDNALPSGTSLMAELLVRLAVLDEHGEYAALGAAMVQGLADVLAKHPSAFGHLLGVADMLVHGTVEVAITGTAQSTARRSLEESLGSTYVPSLLFATVDRSEVALTALTRGKGSASAEATAYVCRRHVCDAPTSDPAELRAQLVAARRGS
ncbi:MAG: thioredoxin domain-containing protein [Gemmatimonadaceae bacterium]